MPTTSTRSMPFSYWDILMQLDIEQLDVKWKLEQLDMDSCSLFILCREQMTKTFITVYYIEVIKYAGPISYPL